MVTRSLLRQKVAGWSPNEVIEYFFSIYLILPAALMVLGFIEPLTDEYEDVHLG
jgi:hypothetical protein